MAACTARDCRQTASGAEDRDAMRALARLVHYQGVTDLPDGTVTFLFSDVEGSTQALERHGAEMGNALARHHELFEEIVARHDGAIFETVGDAVYAAFARAPDAVAAALDAHRALGSENWGPVGRLAVRIAIHTGIVERRGAHYFGPALFRAARLQALGYGEQTLVSGITARLAGDGLPDGASLRDLGVHRLKDLGEPEQVFQLVHPDARGDFPALKSLDSHPHNLPVQLSSFIGREEELSAVAELLEAHRLVTLIGPGGIGKTRLALHAAADQIERFADGVFFVDLAPVRDPELVPGAIASTIGLREQGGAPIAATLAEHLRSRSCLLVLDNLEQLLPAAGPTVAELLAAASGTRILATSRAPLRVRGEREYHLPPLGAGRSDELEPEPPAAVALFVERAREIGVDVAVDAETGPVIAAICSRLDGLPLAIELAAARLRVFGLAQLGDRLAGRLSELGGGASDLPERQQTLRATIAWSEELLAASERRTLARLGVFVGGFTLEAAEAVAGVEPSVDVAGAVTRLLEHSLLRRIDGHPGAGRYGMLEGIREYAAGRLEESGDDTAIHDRLVTHLLALVRSHEPALVGVGQEQALRALDDELANLRDTLRWLRDGSDPRLAELAAGLGRYWTMRGLLSEGRAWIRDASSRGVDRSPQTAARLLHADGLLAGEQGALAEAIDLLHEAARLHRDTGDRAGLTRVLVTLSNAEQASGLFPAAAVTGAEAARLAREVGDVRSEASATGNLAVIALKEGRIDEATAGISEAVELFRKAGDMLAVAIGQGNLGAIAHRQGDPVRAAELHREALATARTLGSPDMEGWARTNLAGALLGAGEWAAAAPLAAEGIAQLLAAEDAVSVVNALGIAAAILAAAGDTRTAAMAWSAAEANADRLGFPLERTETDDADIEQVRVSVEPQLWQEWTRAGTALPYTDAVDLVVGRLTELAAPASEEQVPATPS